MQIIFSESTSTFDFTEALFQAYFDCRSNKRNTINALTFEKHFEYHLFKLKQEILNGSYQPGRSIAFIVDKPVKREIFAADFRDRVVHHLIINKLNPLFEKEFISDSYACRVGKGTHYGIKMVAGFIQNCSHNYTGDCYILKLDILGFFMHINRFILFERLEKFIQVKYHEQDKKLLIHLCKQIIFNDPTQNCTIKGGIKNWEGLPNNKSLFHSFVFLIFNSLFLCFSCSFYNPTYIKKFICLSHLVVFIKLKYSIIFMVNFCAIDTIICPSYISSYITIWLVSN